MNTTTTPLPDHVGIRPAPDIVDQRRETDFGPKVRATMSLDDLAKAQVQIEATVKERDALRALYEKERHDHNRTKDRLQLLNVELEKWQADAKMYMRLATKFATKVADIHTLASKAKELVVELANEELMEGETAQEKEDATKVAQRFGPEAAHGADPRMIAP